MKSSSLIKIRALTGLPDYRAREYRDSIIHEWFLKKDPRERLAIFTVKLGKLKEILEKEQYGEITIKGKRYDIVWISSPQSLKGQTYCVTSLRYCTFLERGYCLIKYATNDEVISLEKLDLT